ncbi:HTH domain-containing protein, partial [Akkermansia sp.]|uniref:HTH domain-containing protein n=1 Tax=Akkermansia sp. TaxID=1872421 RepID=UPI003AB22A46
NPPEKVEIEVKYKIAVTVMELRFWLKDCELPCATRMSHIFSRPFKLSLINDPSA